MKAKVIGIDGTESAEIELPAVFDTIPYRPEVIHKVYVNVLSHSYQRQGRYPAGRRDGQRGVPQHRAWHCPPARARGEGFPRAGQGCRCCWCKARTSCPPPESWKIIYKKINHKEKQLGLCSAIAVTAKKELA